jgi:hypothetical protein
LATSIRCSFLHINFSHPHTKDNSGKTGKIYVKGVARDGWGKLNDNQWTLLWSEQLGQQRWQESPPIANW